MGCDRFPQSSILLAFGPGAGIEGALASRGGAAVGAPPVAGGWPPVPSGHKRNPANRADRTPTLGQKGQERVESFQKWIWNRETRQAALLRPYRRLRGK